MRYMREHRVMMDTKTGGMCLYKTRNPGTSGNNQKLGERRETDFLLETSGRAWPCQHPDIRISASSSGRISVSVVLSYELMTAAVARRKQTGEKERTPHSHGTLNMTKSLLSISTSRGSSGVTH